MVLAASLLPATLLPAAEPAAEPFAIEFILAAGRTMGEPVGAEGPSRLDAARTILLEALADLAAVRDARVGLVLYGHRVAWKPDGDTIDDNANYLAQTNGFAGINMLLPGDDVEVLRPVSAIDPTAVAMLRPSLEALLPFGEAPLFRAVQVAEAATDAAKLGRRGIVLVTDGATQAARAVRPADLESALVSSDRHGVPVHVVVVGGNAAGSDDLEALARGSGGSFRACATAEETRRAVADAVLLVADGDSPAATEDAPGGRGAMTTVSNPSPGKAADDKEKDGPKTTRVTGRVLHGKRAVPRAKVSITGLDGAATTTDAEGRFAFDKVPAGSHEIAVEGIAKNKIRDAREKLLLEAPLPAKKSLEIVLP
jgi:hypothetical protein